MSTIQSIHLFVALNIFIIGLSHFFQVKIWVEYFQFLHKKGNVGNIINALMSLFFGSIILSFHFVWNWPLVLVTIYACMQLLKGLIFLVFPEIGIRSIGKVDASYQKFKWVGMLMMLMGLLPAS